VHQGGHAGLVEASPHWGAQQGKQDDYHHEESRGRKAAPVTETAPADASAPAAEWVNPRPASEWAAAIEKTGKSLNALCAEAGGPAGGANPSQIRRHAWRGRRVEAGRAHRIAEEIGAPFAKMWAPAS